jgi:hypothetical protein
MGQASLDDIVSNQGPAAASSATVGGTAHIDDIISNQGSVSAPSRSDEINKMAFAPIPKPEPITPPQDHKEELVKNIAGDRGLVSYRAAREAVMHVENLIKSPAGAYDAAKQYVQSIPDTIKKAVMPEPYNLDPTQHEFRDAPITPIPGVGSAAAAFTDEASMAAAGAQDVAAGSQAMAPQTAPVAAAPKTLLKNPFFAKIKQAVSPTAASQPGAQTTLRVGAAASAADAGVAVAAPAEGVGIRTLLTQPIEQAKTLERGLYDTLNKAAETDMKSLYEKQADIQEALDDPTQIAHKQALQTELNTTQTRINWGEDNVQKALGKDAQKLLRQAKDATQQRYAMEIGDAKLFNNESVVKGNVAHGGEETINVDSAIKNAELLDKPSKFAPRGSPTRLQQMFGVNGAKAFKDGLYAAQKAGQKVATRNSIIKWTAGALGVGTTLAGGAELLAR